ncbi:MAG TPA: trypsin-like peptidase domain-containing protein [Polyangia bacterium]|jgi:serine protease Do
MRRLALTLILAAAALRAAPAGAAPEPERLYTEMTRGPDLPDRLGPLSVARLVERVAATVVGIEVRTMPRFGSGGGPALGSGFIIHKDGYILTNHHVVERGDEIRVRLADEREFVARMVGSDPRADLALLRIEDAGPLVVAPLGDSDRLRIGEMVVAIGNPFGLDHSVTAGIVSAKGRRSRDVQLREGQQGYFDFIQTDAAINRGNSGGPLFNLRGEVVGINTAMLGGPHAQAPGIGFAMPVNMAKKIVPLLKQHGRAPRSWLGVHVQGLSPNLAKGFGLTTLEGALVSHVIPGSPAALAGVVSGDVLLEFDGKRVVRSDEMRWLSSTAGIGRKVAVWVWRARRRVRADVTLVIHPDERAAPASAPAPAARKPPQSALGVEVADMTAFVARRLGLCPVAGVMVTSYEPSAPAVEAGLSKYDLVVRVGDAQIRTLDDYARAVRAVPPGGVLRLLVARFPAGTVGCEDRAAFQWVAFPKRLGSPP